VDEEPEEAAIGEVSLLQLIEALRTVLVHFPEEAKHEVTLDRFSMQERIGEIAVFLQQGEGKLEFETLFAQCGSRRDVIGTFLALLEMVKIQMVKLYQTAAFGSIRIELVGPVEEIPGLEYEEEGEGASGSE